MIKPIEDRIVVCAMKEITSRAYRVPYPLGWFRAFLPASRNVAVISIQHALRHNVTRAWRVPLFNKKVPQLVVTIADELHHVERPAEISGDKISFLPTQRVMLDIFDFADKHSNKTIFIHCFAGIHRSAAAACALVARSLGPGKEVEAVEKTLAIRSRAAPSLPMMQIADDLLGRNDALIAAVRCHPDIARRLNRYSYYWATRQSIVKFSKLKHARSAALHN